MKEKCSKDIYTEFVLVENMTHNEFNFLKHLVQPIFKFLNKVYNENVGD